MAKFFISWHTRFVLFLDFSLFSCKFFLCGEDIERVNLERVRICKRARKREIKQFFTFLSLVKSFSNFSDFRTFKLYLGLLIFTDVFDDLLAVASFTFFTQSSTRSFSTIFVVGSTIFVCCFCFSTNESKLFQKSPSLIVPEKLETLKPQENYSEKLKNFQIVQKLFAKWALQNFYILNSPSTCPKLQLIVFDSAKCEWAKTEARAE